ncbi:MAG: glycoside hydrolase family 3 C-terminal domain-containing protein [Spirochaetales bacterium]|nr:glycoside hydrolase family 3 C-terminal domain-containing protein [Spirochaetales bacterium]
MPANTTGSEAPLLESGGFKFRDLNKNGKLDVYEDKRKPIEDRVEDLLSQMTIEEKAGMMFHSMIGMNPDGTLAEQQTMFNPIATSELVLNRLLNHFNVYNVADPRQMAEWHNRLQKLAEKTRLVIPVTISSDPRHTFIKDTAVNIATDAFSKWPEPTGLAATRDEKLVQEFADIARQEYIAVGIRTALHPMADLATEPRWARINGTFGEDAALSAKMVTAYIKGFQGPKIGPESVACMTKHFPGGGPQKDGEDPHFSFGKDQVYPGNNFDYHLIPFEAAFKAGTAQIMPYYGRPLGLPLEEVGFGYNHDVVTGLLRKKYGFDGVVCTDWLLVNSVIIDGKEAIEAKCWGAENLSTEERVKKIIDAGCDQFGGEACPEVVIDLVKSGKIKEERIDESVRRLLRDKFRLGLFDSPLVDPEATVKIVGNSAFRKAGETAQRKSIVLLKNGRQDNEKILPLKGKPRIYIEGIEPETAKEYGEVVQTPEQADLAILRLSAPFEPREGLLESMFHAGDLDFKGKEKNRILELCDKLPVIVDIFLDRPAVIPEIAGKCVALLGNFGANDAAVLDILFGRFSPVGKLPFELPSSMEAVKKQKEDVPYDSENPLFPFGFGLRY